jgi:hypothetical protein
LDVSVGDDKLDTLIDGAIGELSAFDETFSVYAHRDGLVSFQTPVHWQKRARVRQGPANRVEIIFPPERMQNKIRWSLFNPLGNFLIKGAQKNAPAINSSKNPA